VIFLFEFLKERKLKKLMSKVSGFIDWNYDDPEISKKRFGGNSQGEVRYMVSQIDEDVRYSVDIDAKHHNKDGYDTDYVKDLMKNYSTSDAQRVLSELEKKQNRTFTDCLLDYINQKKIRDSAVYNAAQLDRRLFSKIMSDREYKPSKDTALAVIFALKLSLSQAEDLLSRAGYTLAHSSKRDIIIEYFLREKVYSNRQIIPRL